VQLIANNKELEKITLNNSNNWKAVIDELPFNENGEQIDYEVKEISKPEGYTTNIVEKGGLYEITNTHIPEIVTAKVEKLWIDENNLDGVRPEEVEVVLLKNGKATEQSLILSEKNHWQGEIENLIKKENGKEIQYSFVLKENIPEYSTTYEQNENLTKITSVHDSMKTEASVKKVWEDNNSSKRPESIIVILCKDGKATEKQVLLSEKNNWQATISDLLKYEKGKEIEYSFIEKEIPKGYTNKTETKEGITVITNTLERELINNPDTEDEPDKPMKEPEETTKETITEKPNKNVEKTDANASPVKTGDTTGIIILLLLCVVSGIGLYRKK